MTAPQVTDGAKRRGKRERSVTWKDCSAERCHGKKEGIGCHNTAAV